MIAICEQALSLNILCFFLLFMHTIKSETVIQTYFILFFLASNPNEVEPNSTQINKGQLPKTKRKGYTYLLIVRKIATMSYLVHIEGFVVVLVLIQIPIVPSLSQLSFFASFQVLMSMNMIYVLWRTTGKVR